MKYLLIILLFLTTTIYGQQMRINLYAHNPDNTVSLNDGCLTTYGTWSNYVDMWDALKVPQIAEELSLNRNDTLIGIERRKIISVTDTSYINLRNLQQKSYRFEIICTSLLQAGLKGKVVDAFLNKTYLLNLSGTVLVEWAVTSNPASYAANRFKVIFYQQVLVSAFIKLSTNKNGIVWQSDNTGSYQIEYSSNGATFTPVAYTTDKKAVLNKDGFYRVTGNQVYSNIVRWIGNLMVTPNMIYNPSCKFLTIYLYNGQWYYSGTNTQISVPGAVIIN